MSTPPQQTPDQITDQTTDAVLLNLLAMPKDQQKQVLAVLQLLHGEQGDFALAPATPTPEPGGADEDYMTLEQFMECIQPMPPYEQLLNLDQVLREADELSEREQEILTSARLRLLNDHKWLALRYGVTNYAIQKPVWLCVGAGGLVLLVITFSANLFRRIF